MEYESLRYPSFCLFRQLENIIGTKGEVALRRKLLSMRNYAIDVMAKNKLLYSGSRTEGFNFESSDFDDMIIDKCTVATESTEYLQSDDHNKTVLLMRRDMCNPGFVILQLVNRPNNYSIFASLLNNYSIFASLLKYKNYDVVSSLLYRDTFRRQKYGEVAHGPCNTYNIGCGIDIDTAHCFQLNSWPTVAYDFIHRPRPHEWPSKVLLDKIVCGSCHLVPIGDKGHDLERIQWRLSFSAAEKALVHSFNHTQFLVYGLMKIFLKQVINKVKSVENLLCSYFLKTALFYSIENTPQSLWREDLIIPCFWFCFNRLIEWVECGYCPNFFVPENNMFRGKVYGENQRKLLTVLNQLKSDGWTCICLCDDLHEFRNYLNHSEPVFHIGLIPSDAKVEQRRDCETLELLISVRKFNSVSEIHNTLSRLLLSISSSRSQQERDISTLNLLGVLRSAGQFHFCNKVGRNNKARYRLVRQCQILVQKSSNREVGVGPLTLAMYYYANGQNKKAVQICQRLISQWKPFVSYSPIRQNRLAESYERNVCGRGISLVDKVRKACAVEIEMMPVYKDFYPAELSYDIEATSPFYTYVPPLPYTVFLLCLCHIKLGNIDNSLAALRDLQTLKVQGYRHYPVVLNLLAICYEKLGYVDNAINLCVQSKRLKPQRNGAFKLLEKLLREHA